MSRGDDWIQWRKRDTAATSYLSTFPRATWQIVRRGQEWDVMRAVDDGDPYTSIGLYPTLAEAKLAANRY